MSRKIYTSEAFVFKERNFGEADKIYSFFTKNFGRIDATAQGVRRLRSKLRYSLSGLSFVRISFVSTSNGYWRLTGAEEILSFDNTRGSLEKIRCSFVLFSLLDRLIQGQQADRELWEKLAKIFLFIEENDLGKSELKNFEILSALHILKHLGYMEGGQGTDDLSLDDVGKKSEHFLSLVQRSVERSQL